MTTDEERDAIVSLLETVPDLGGDDASPANRKIHKFFYESDDVEEAKKYWQTTLGGATVINAVMLTREDREDREPVSGKEFARVNNFRLLFRYGKEKDPVAEKTFEKILDGIMDAIQGSDIFKDDDSGTPGLHPQPEEDQVASASTQNIKLFHQRVWEASITFPLVKRRFVA